MSKEKKQLPLVWVLVRCIGIRKGMVERTDVGDVQALFEPAAFDGSSCEPYIPAARVTAMIETLRKQIGILTTLPASQTELHCAIAHLEQLISDVEA